LDLKKMLCVVESVIWSYVIGRKYMDRVSNACEDAPLLVCCKYFSGGGQIFDAKAGFRVSVVNCLLTFTILTSSSHLIC
jgi:hypothetical protein